MTYVFLFKRPAPLDEVIIYLTEALGIDSLRYNGKKITLNQRPENGTRPVPAYDVIPVTYSDNLTPRIRITRVGEPKAEIDAKKMQRDITDRFG